MPTMTVGELKDLLEQYDDEMGVAIAYQPNYPLKAALNGVRSQREAIEMQLENEPRLPDAETTLAEEVDSLLTAEQPDRVYLVAGGNAPTYDENPYASEALFW